MLLYKQVKREQTTIEEGVNKMKIALATVDIEKNIVTLQGVFGERFEFNMNECKTLPKWADDELNKMHFVRQIGNCMFFE